MIAVSYSIDGSECFGMSWEAILIETKATAGRRKDSGRRLGRKKEKEGEERTWNWGEGRKEGKDRGGGGGRKEGEREYYSESLSYRTSAFHWLVARRGRMPGEIQQWGNRTKRNS